MLHASFGKQPASEHRQTGQAQGEPPSDELMNSCCMAYAARLHRWSALNNASHTCGSSSCRLDCSLSVLLGACLRHKGCMLQWCVCMTIVLAHVCRVCSAAFLIALQVVVCVCVCVHGRARVHVPPAAFCMRQAPWKRVRPGRQCQVRQAVQQACSLSLCVLLCPVSLAGRCFLVGYFAQRACSAQVGPTQV
jgi:hypothetical protein